MKPVVISKQPAISKSPGEKYMTNTTRLVTGGRIFTTDPDQLWAEALLVEGDRITRVGGDELIAEYANKEIEHLDIAGGLVVPGFFDGHVHVGMTGSSMLKAQLQGAGSLYPGGPGGTGPPGSRVPSASCCSLPSSGGQNTLARCKSVRAVNRWRSLGPTL